MSDSLKADDSLSNDKATLLTGTLKLGSIQSKIIGKNADQPFQRIASYLTNRFCRSQNPFNKGSTAKNPIFKLAIVQTAEKPLGLMDGFFTSLLIPLAIR